MKVENKTNINSSTTSVCNPTSLLGYQFNKSLATMPSSADLKKRRKIKHRQEKRAIVRANRASSARFLSSVLSLAANNALSTNQSQLALPVTSDDDCCADSGATDIMLNDYDAFTSYNNLVGQYATMGDDTVLPILGIGTAVFNMNGKVVKIRNCLHVPDLRNPLYSLRYHRFLPDCGVFSHHDCGSYMFVSHHSQFW